MVITFSDFYFLKYLSFGEIYDWNNYSLLKISYEKFTVSLQLHAPLTVIDHIITGENRAWFLPLMCDFLGSWGLDNEACFADMCWGLLKLCSLIAP